MKKILIIGWKDFTIIWRDRAALILMLAAPFVLTLGLGFVSGRFSGRTSGLGDIPVVLVNQDQGARVTNVAVREPNLEAVFLHLTGRALRD